MAQKSTDSKGTSIYSGLDCVYQIAQEKIYGNGEDSFCYDIYGHRALFGVFDGCGGSGAKKYDAYQSKTGAYIGARAVAGAVHTWFRKEKYFPKLKENQRNILQIIQSSLTVCKNNSGAQGHGGLKGSISREFPTTAALACCVQNPDGIWVDCYWAGDSRVYLLDENGLAQLTEDDLEGLDAYENISGDGVLTNVISASRTFELHGKRIFPQKPFLIFAATDGCFGYIPSPMEFELCILDSILDAESMSVFERRLHGVFGKNAGDDYTLIGGAFGFGTFSTMQKALSCRYEELVKNYISHIDEKYSESRRVVWEQYKYGYNRFRRRTQ